ncbi:histidine kinase [Flammeovirga sp. MY04]|uniref:sensor histidine kinase n=1 Tax=Flammeovirga sp. MY04 TaxID=1191459 RepID=UPI0008063F22|nr:histidine kinase [Flammeovirga sp. MY04]ANQ52701.1 histidine kinase [Flammeovirga sp. MY04]
MKLNLFKPSVRSKLLHITIHLICWAIYIFLLSYRDLLFNDALINNFWTFSVITSPLVPFVYFNLYVLIPRLLFKKKPLMYTLALSILFTVCINIRYSTAFYFYAKVLCINSIEPFFSGRVGWWTASSETFGLFFISISLFLLHNWYAKERYVKELENKNMAAELNLLKSQLQPHFLFNNLNTIYFLMDSQPEKAKELVVQLSDALSHQLYKANQDKVMLEEELEYLESYIKIEQIRHQDFLELNYNFPEETSKLSIAPMLLMTFIENAFKHSTHSKGYKINIDISLNGNELKLHVINTKGEAKANKKVGGLGLTNVRKRLQLLYPQMHQLEITEHESEFEVNLTLELNE